MHNRKLLYKFSLFVLGLKLFNKKKSLPKSPKTVQSQFELMAQDYKM